MPWNEAGFDVALGASSLVAILVVIAAALATSRGHRVPLGGGAFIVGAVVGLDAVDAPPDMPLSAFVVLGLGSTVAGLLAPRVIHLVATLPGAILVAAAATDAPTWARVAAVAVVPLATSGLIIGDRVVSGLGAGSFVTAVAAAGTWVTVPDTELAVVLFAAAIPMGLLSLPPFRVPIGAALAGPAVGMLAWIVLESAGGRDGAFVGGLSVWGVVLLLPLLLRSDPDDLAPTLHRALPAAGLVVASALWSSRVGGLQNNAVAAATMCAAGLLVGGLVARRMLTSG